MTPVANSGLWPPPPLPGKVWSTSSIWPIMFAADAAGFRRVSLSESGPELGVCWERLIRSHDLKQALGFKLVNLRPAPLCFYNVFSYLKLSYFLSSKKFQNPFLKIQNDQRSILAAAQLSASGERNPGAQEPQSYRMDMNVSTQTSQTKISHWPELIFCQILNLPKFADMMSIIAIISKVDERS